MKTKNMKTKNRASEFNPNQMIADLQQLAKDWKKGDLRNYRVTSIPGGVSET